MNSLSSLGAGSGGVLNYDIIDKLKKADERSHITPIDKKLQDNIAKQSEIAVLNTMLNSLKGNTKKITDYSSYLQRSVKSSDENSLKVSVGAGVPIQDINIKIDEIAKNSVNEVGAKFSSRESKFFGKDSVLKFHIDGKNYNIQLSSNDTLESVAQRIIDNTDSLVGASIMKTGEGENSYSLMINSKESGAKNTLYFGNVLETKNISENLELNEGDLSLKLIDENGVSRVINIVAPQVNGADGLKNAILQALSADLAFANLINSGEVGVHLSADGKKIVLNDKRGFGMSVDGTKSDEIFDEKSVEEGDTIVGHSAVSAGKISGLVTIGTQNLKLEDITSGGNTARQNAEAIAEAINATEGYAARVDDEGKLRINSSTGEISVKASAENKEALAKIGLNAGNFADWAIMQEKLNIKNIQQASDARFSYNGVNITRPSNNVSDVVNGVTLELLSPSEKDINVSVSGDNNSIVEEVKGFVENYNALVPKLNELTKYDEDTKIAGIFNGVSDIRTIRTSLNRALSTTRWEDDKNHSIIDYGLSFNDAGMLIFDQAKLQNALSADSQKVIDFFRGNKTTIAGKEVEQKGVFALVEAELDMLTSGPNARLKALEDNFVSDDKRLKEERKRSIEMLDKRYEMMANRFAAYDSQIAKVNNSFNSLNMLIEQSIADKKK